MKKIALSLTVFALFIGSFPAYSSTPSLKDKIHAMHERIHKKVELAKKHFRDRINHPEVQARLAQIRAFRKRIAIEILENSFKFIKNYKNNIQPYIRAKLDVLTIKVRYGIRSKLRLFRPKAVAWYDAQMDALISTLPPELQIPIKLVRNNPVYKNSRKALADRIIKVIQENKDKLADKVRYKFQELIDAKLVELSDHIQKRLVNLNR